MKMETQITAITLNCWGIRGISKDRVPRMNAIAEELASGKYDFVFLQEIWTNEDYERIKIKAQPVLPYSFYFYSGVIGSGLCVLSRSPIINAFFHQWAVNGYMHKIQHGDWFGGKGIGMVQVLHQGLKINLYTAHLHAEYDRVNDEYLAHRVTQSFDTAQFITLTSQNADVAIIGGDLNTEPGDLSYRIMVHTAQLRDSFFSLPKTPDTGEAIGYTCETPSNSYTSPSSLRSNPFGKRIDYVIFKSGEFVQVTTLSCDTPWPKKVPGQQFSYSDHEAVVAKFKIVKSSVAADPVPASASARKEALEESVEICSQALRHLSSTRALYLTLSLICCVTMAVTVSVEIFQSMGILLTACNIVLLLMVVYSMFMGLIWNRMEVHGILAGKLAMELEVGKHANDAGDSYDRIPDEHWKSFSSSPRPQILMPKFSQ